MHISRTTSNLDIAGQVGEDRQSARERWSHQRKRYAKYSPDVGNEVMERVLEANEGGLGKYIEQVALSKVSM